MALDLTDKSPSGYTLTNHGATEYTTDHPFAASIRAAQCASASSQYLEAAGSAGMLLANSDLTVEIWVRILSWGAPDYMIFLGQDDATLGRAFDLDNSGTHFKMTINGSPISVVSTNVPVTTWTHIAMTWKDSTQTLSAYQNGAPDGALTTAGVHIPTTTALLDVCRRSFAANESYANCDITEIRIFNRVRTPTEIANNYNIQLVGNETGLVAYYPFQALSTSGGGFVPVLNIQSLLFASR